MTLPPENKWYVRFFPASLRLLTTPGMRGHSLIFTGIMAAIFTVAYAGKALAFSESFTIVFDLGAATGATYLVLSLFTLSEKTKNILFNSTMTVRLLILAFLYAPILAGLYYWTSQAGSVVALPIFPIFIVIFYGWVLLQAYFIATPTTHLLARVEKTLVGDGHRKKINTTIGLFSLVIPIVPLVYGVWAISTWLSGTYQNVSGSADKIIAWTIVVIVLLLLTYTTSLQWGWRTIKSGRPQAAIFAGGTFLVLWAYLLYRATTMGIGFITQNEPSNPVLDTGLIAISIFGAMQTFAGKAAKRRDKRLGEIVPFLVFAFGAVYSVAQFYFILQFTITRIELSILINGTVFATGIAIMMMLIRRHLLGASELSHLNNGGSQVSGVLPQDERVHASSPRARILSFIRLPWKRKSEDRSGSPSQPTDTNDSEQV